MARRVLNAIGIGLVVLICICGVLLESWKQGMDFAEKAAAEKLYPVLAGHDFDSIELDESQSEIQLYQYWTAENSSTRELVRTETMPIDDSLIPEVKRFRNAQSFRGGVFFATDLTWDGEWSGLCLHPTDLDGIPPEKIESTDIEGMYRIQSVYEFILSE